MKTSPIAKTAIGAALALTSVGIAVAAPAQAVTTSHGSAVSEAAKPVPNTLGTQLTIYNESKKGLTIDFATVSIIDPVVKPHGSYTVSGDSTFTKDIDGSFKYGNHNVTVIANNPYGFDRPWVAIDGDKVNFSEGDSHTFKVKGHEYEVTRLGDTSGYKDFKMVVKS